MNVKKCANGHFFDADKYQLCPHCGASIEVMPETQSKKEESRDSSRQIPWKRKKRNHNVEVTPMTQKTMGKTFSVFDEQPKPQPQSKIVKNSPQVTQKPKQDVQPNQQKQPEVVYTPAEELMDCPKCGHKTSVTSRFCRYCGSAVTAPTPKTQSREPETIVSNVQESASNTEEPKAVSHSIDEKNFLFEAKDNSVVIPEVKPQPVDEPQHKSSLEAAVRSAVSAGEGKTIGFFSMGTNDSHTETEPVVGWLVCIKGNHFGESLQITVGRNAVGRGVSNKIVITGDKSVSREKHCWITYDPKHRKFFVQPGESSGLTYLNDEIVMEYKQLKAKDKLEVGEGVYLFVPLCNDEFSWEDYM